MAAFSQGIWLCCANVSPEYTQFRRFAAKLLHECLCSPRSAPQARLTGLASQKPFANVKVDGKHDAAAAA
jgi:hypothetical protein